MRFVSPETVRIDLDAAKGEWIEVKKELTVGEDRAYQTAGIGRRAESQDAVEIDWKRRSTRLVEAYLVDWSEKRKVTREAIERLAVEDFEKIQTVILAHIGSVEEEKKRQTETSTSASA